MIILICDNSSIIFVVLAIIFVGYYNTALTKIAETWEHSDIAVRQTDRFQTVQPFSQFI